MSRYLHRVLVVAIAFTVLSTMWPAAAGAQGRRRGRGPVVVVGGGYYGGYFYDPFFGPYPFGPYGYRSFYGGAYMDDADVRVLVTPKEAEVFVDGYYAGIVDDFDGVFQRLSVRPGGHEFVLYREGWRTVRQTAYVTPRSTYKLRSTMAPLSPGETAEPRPVPAAPPQGSPLGPPPARLTPGMPQPAGPPVQPGPPTSWQQPERSRFGTLAVRVQPADAEVLVDGERWRGPETDEHLLVQVAEGRHRIEIRKDGYQPFSTEIEVRGGETVPINVSLPQSSR